MALGTLWHKPERAEFLKSVDDLRPILEAAPFPRDSAGSGGPKKVSQISLHQPVAGGEREKRCTPPTHTPGTNHKCSAGNIWFQSQRERHSKHSDVPGLLAHFRVIDE